MSSYIQLIDGLRTAKDAAATLGTPSTDAHGINIKPWRTLATPKSFTQAVIALSADATSNITSPVLYGYGPLTSATAQWFVIGSLNSGTTIALTLTMGFSQILQFPTVFTRLAVGGTPSAGNVIYAATPIMVENQ